MSHWTCTYKEGTLSDIMTKIRTVICHWRQTGLLFEQKSATHLIFTYTRNSAIADKPCDAFRDINLRQILWPWNQGWGSLKFIGNITIRYSACVFLLTFCSKYGYRVVSEICNVEKCHDLEIRARGHSRSSKVVPFDRLCCFLSLKSDTGPQQSSRLCIASCGNTRSSADADKPARRLVVLGSKWNNEK